MSNNLNSAIRMTDSLERELLARAMEEQHEYYLDRKLKQFFTRIVDSLKGPKVTVRHATQGSH
jgi:hypothetical protein